MMPMRRAAMVAMFACLPVAVGACGDDEADGDLAAFCEADAAINSADPFSGETAEEVEQIAAEMREAFATARRAAPEEIADEAEVVSRVFEGMLDELEAADFEPGARDPEELFTEAAAADPEFEPALGRLGEYTAEECGG